MYKKLILFVLLFSIFNGFGQNFILLKNYNPKVKELKHSLNATKDSLVLECEQPILQVEIFNEDFERLIKVEASNTKIPLKDIPVGEFSVEVKLVDKIILMDLIGRRRADQSTVSVNKNEIVIEKGMMLDENLNAVKISSNKSVAHLLSRRHTKRNTEKKKFYWTVHKTNNKHGSSKTMKLMDQESVDKMIEKNKIELNSASGKSNELTVWEVYNTTKFMKNQTSNPDFIYSSSSNLFNSEPYYAKENTLQNP
jgi:ribosomal protein L28